MNILRRLFGEKHLPNELVPLFKPAGCVLTNFDVTKAHKLVQIPMNTPNIIYYVFLKLDIQYGYSTTLFLRKYFIRKYYKLLKSAV